MGNIEEKGPAEQVEGTFFGSDGEMYAVVEKSGFRGRHRLRTGFLYHNKYLPVTCVHVDASQTLRNFQHFVLLCFVFK